MESLQIYWNLNSHLEISWNLTGSPGKFEPWASGNLAPFQLPGNWQAQFNLEIMSTKIK